MMAHTSAWNDFHVEKLRGTLILNADLDAVKEYQIPTKVQYTWWMINIKKTFKVCRQQWIPTAALKLKYSCGEFALIVNLG